MKIPSVAMRTVAGLILMVGLLMWIIYSNGGYSKELEANSTALQIEGETPVSPLILPSSTPTNTPTRLPTATPAPPRFVSSQPDTGEQWGGQPITLRFDQPMAEQGTKHLTINPPLPGYTAAQGDQLIFSPDLPPIVGQAYTLTLSTNAQSMHGVELEKPVQIVLVATKFLNVTSVQPESNAFNVELDQEIVVAFNRPVVDKMGTDDSGPQPLTITPPLAGTGAWINRNLYRFQPSHRLDGSTAYTVTIDSLMAQDGTPLSTPYQFSFRTVEPIVTNVSPRGRHIRPDAAFQVSFSQSMDRESTQEAFLLTKILTHTQEFVHGHFGWNDENTIVTFTPRQRLDSGGNYRIMVGQEAQTLSQRGTLQHPYVNTFRVAPRPKIVNMIPAHGSRNVSPNQDISIRFNTPVSPTLALANIQISPMPTYTQVYSSYDGSTVRLSWPKQPQSSYTIYVGDEIADNYGNRVEASRTFTFTVGNDAAFVNLGFGGIVHFSAQDIPLINATYKNVDRIQAELLHLPFDTFLNTTRNHWWQDVNLSQRSFNRIWLRNYRSQAELNDVAYQTIKLSNAAGDRLPPGVYLLELHTPQYSRSSQVVIVLSHYHLLVKKGQSGDSLAWLVDLRNGQPVAHQPLHFYRDGKEVAEGVTDRDGLVQVQLEDAQPHHDSPLLAISGTPEEETFAVVSSDWNQGVAAHEFGLPRSYGSDQVRSHFYTDRPIYRPGQTIYWKGMVRMATDSVYALPAADTELSIALRDSRGNTIKQVETTVNEYGTAHGQFELAPEALTGNYYLEARITADGTHLGNGGKSIQVATYEKPEFNIQVATSKSEYVQGETVKVQVQANYFSGGPMANASVEWKILTGPSTFQWQNAASRRFTFQPYNPEGMASYYGHYYRQNGSQRLHVEGTGTTDAAGNLIIEVPAELEQDETTAMQSQRWVIDVTVQSPTNQFVSGRDFVRVHGADTYIGLHAQRRAIRAGDQHTFDIVTVSPEQAVQPHVDLDVMVYRVRWNSVYEWSDEGHYRWRNEAERTPVHRQQVQTDQEGTAAVTWTASSGGQYQIVAQGKDGADVPISGTAYVWASSSRHSHFATWHRSDHNRIELVADKDAYEPGDVAQILVPVPFAGPAQALVTIEQAGVVESNVVTLESNSDLLEISITNRHIPNIYVSVTVLKHADETTPAPAFAVGYLNLAVDTHKKTLQVDIESSTEIARPGDKIGYTLTVVDSRNRSIPNAEVSVALIDEAVLSLSTERPRSLMDVFYNERPLGVDSGILMVLNKDQLTQQILSGTKGGGGGGGGLSIRQDFPDSVFWRADFITDQEGRITFDVELPDNLTTWQLVVKAITADTMVGEATKSIVATTELQIRPLLPRFLTANDRVQIGATVLNSGQQSLHRGAFTLDISGAEIVSKTSSTAFTLAPGERTHFDIPIVVEPNATTVVVTYTAQAQIRGNRTTNTSSRVSDAIKISIPVHHYTSRELVSTSGTVPDGGAEVLIPSPAYGIESGELQINLEATLAAGMTDALSYLHHYPYECNEQTLSKFLPNLFTVRTLRNLGIEREGLEKRLEEELDVAVQRLLNRQNGDGGWGYWPNDESRPFTSSYVLWGLYHVQQTGYAIPQIVLDNAASYLDRHFMTPSRTQAQWQLNEMAFTHFALSEMGAGDPGRASTLYDERARLGLYGKAFLLMALDNMRTSNAKDSRIATLAEELVESVIEDGVHAHWQEKAIDWWTFNTNTRATAAILAALIRVEPNHSLLPKVVRWLMDTRQQGRWSNTQENAWSIIALTDWMEATGELEANYNWSVAVNEEEIGRGRYTSENLREQIQLRTQVSDLLREESIAIQFDRTNQTSGNVKGQLYYSTRIHARLDPLLALPLDRGIVLNREFRINGEVVNSAKVGDIIDVVLTIIAPSSLYHLMVEAPIPAGTEPLDTQLATTTSSAERPQMTNQSSPYYSWYYWTPRYTDIRDEKVAFFANRLRQGVYEYTFQVRASVPGEYRVLPVYAEQMYYTDVWGQSEGTLFVVQE